MKNIKYFEKKYAYDNGQWSSADEDTQYWGRAKDEDIEENQDNFRNKDRENELKEIKDEEKANDNDGNVLTPHDDFDGMYQNMKGVEGLYSSPLENYMQDISEEPGSQMVNPWANVYQSASNRIIKSIIRKQSFHQFSNKKA